MNMVTVSLAENSRRAFFFFGKKLSLTLDERGPFNVNLDDFTDAEVLNIHANWQQGNIEAGKADILVARANEIIRLAQNSVVPPAKRPEPEVPVVTPTIEEVQLKLSEYLD